MTVATAKKRTRVVATERFDVNAPLRLPKSRTSHPLLTPKRIAELAALAKKIDREEAEEIKATVRAAMARHEAVVGLIATLRAARVENGLTVTEVGERSGIGKANVSRLENDPRPNPTWDTLARYAEAVGKRIEPTIRDA